MNRAYFKWVLLTAFASLLLIIFFMINKHYQKNDVIESPPVAQPLAPFNSYISAVGIVEPKGGNINIGSPLNRVVSQVNVKVNQKVKKGDILFQLNSTDLAAELISKQFDYETAKANLKKLESLPRSEDIATADAQLKSAQVEYEQAKSEYKRVEGIQSNGAMSAEEIAKRRFALDNAQSKLQLAIATFEKTKAGAWKPDLEIARLNVLQAKSLKEGVEAEIERTIIRAPSEGIVLQIKIHEGESPDISRPSMIIGNTDKKCLRVSVNQFDAPYFNPINSAYAYVQGNSKLGFVLKFDHIEPYLVAKQNISNDISEKIDTRVLQVIYCFDEGENSIYVNQQMNVFIETRPTLNTDIKNEK